MPSDTWPVVTRRQRAMSSFRANATIIVLRVLPRPSAVRARNHCVRALFSWNLRKRQAKLDHPTADASVTGARKTPFAPASTALIRRAGETGVAGDRIAVAPVAREHL